MRDVDPSADDAAETVALDGELVIDTVRRAHGRLAGTTASTVVADLAGVTFIDSTGLRMLLDAKSELEAQGRTLTVVNPNSSARLLFEATGTADQLGVQLD